MAHIKAVYRYVDEQDRARFADSKCLLTISVGQEVHEEEKFAATIDLVNTTFGACIMLIDDSLQRHTMVLEKTESPSELHELAVQEGDRWLERNKKYYSQLTNLQYIIRWDKWLNHENYLSAHQQLSRLLQEDSTYAQVLEDTIDEFLRRYCNRLLSQANFDYERAHQLCLDYLLEECCAMTLWPELSCHYEVYPSRRNLAMQETHKRFVLPMHPDLLHAVAIKFKNRKQLKPQQFSMLELPSSARQLST